MSVAGMVFKFGALKDGEFSEWGLGWIGKGDWVRGCVGSLCGGFRALYRGS